MLYGDTTTGSFASGVVGLEAVTIAGVSIAQQPFALIEDTTNNIVGFNTGASGILGLSFPTARWVRRKLCLFLS